MEVQEQPKHEPVLIFTKQSQTYLQQSGKWASFLGVIGFVVCGLILPVVLLAPIKSFLKNSNINSEELSVYIGLIIRGVYIY